MSDYIDRERLKKALNADLQTLQTIDEHSISLILAEIDEAPSENVAPVVHAHWIKRGRRYFECSNCYKLETASKAIAGHHCWYCGAEMIPQQEASML